MSSRKIDLTGHIYGRLTVLREADRNGRTSIQWLCLCECGNESTAAPGNLRNGHTKSCGCLNAELSSERNSTHRMTRTSKAYEVWGNMRGRCNNPNNLAYKNYGMRGINVCTEWDSFETFYADMGEPPDGLTIDRIDNNAGYSKKNCRWATKDEQGSNRRSVLHLTHDGVTLTLKEWAKKTGISKVALYLRVRRGWSVQRTFSQPMRVGGKT